MSALNADPGGSSHYLRTKGEAGTGNVVEAVRHMRTITNELNEVIACDDNEVVALSKKSHFISDALRLAAVSVVKNGLPVPAAKITILFFSICLIALLLI